MATLHNTIPKFTVFVVDADHHSSISIQSSLEAGLGDEVAIKVFSNGESCLAEMNDHGQKPSVVILEYSENKRLNATCGEHMVDCIKKLSPESAIIILSDKANSDRAIKTLAYGAHDFVVKDRFLNEHIFSSVKKSLHPAKM